MKPEQGITSINAFQVLDSRAIPTIKCQINQGKEIGWAIIPSGKSTGTFEASELRDGYEVFKGKSVLKAIDNIEHKIFPKIKGKDPLKQKEIDNTMIKLDGTENKSKLGGNAILAVSLANARLAANLQKIELFEWLGKLSSNNSFSLPVPMLNVLNGGAHAGTELKIQEFMIVPIRAKSFAEAIQFSCDIYYSLKNLIEKDYGKSAINLGDEGGFVPQIINSHDALDLLEKAIDSVGLHDRVKIAIDCAASSFFDSKKNSYLIDRKVMKANALTDYYVDLVSSYEIISIEDPFHEESFSDFKELKIKLKGKAQVVSDDLTVSNPTRIKKAIVQESANALLLKANQIGSLTEAIQANQIAQKAGWKIVTSHRSGDSEDSFIADLAVGLASDQVKFGAPARSERTCKYNRLLEIENQFGKQIKYLGKNAFF